MEHSNLSLEEIQRQLQEADSKRNQLEKLLNDKREEGKGAIVEQIRNIILDNDYDPEEIMNLVLRRRRKLVSDRQYRRYVDPENPNNFYSRGVLPGWMKEKMVEQGYDPSSKEDRETFKASSLTLVEG
ncbi:H-NS family nucleoid-associated regulatory protein [Allochromatium palmeri]|uniref:H-NS histone family protein n=1 Tax=Allochromatium palmeri TaxID=231048 RepID=A0A6N8EAV0_9GAMM|nr:H-NS histone family protein [Allochromatium palmeri]